MSVIVTADPVPNLTLPHNVNACTAGRDYTQFIFGCEDSDRLWQLKMISLVLNTGVGGSLCVLGLIGNTLSIAVLRRDNPSKVAVCLLQGLAVADNGFLLVSLVFMCAGGGLLPVLAEEVALKQPWTLRFLVAGNTLAFITQTATIWMTVLLSLNRYLAICRPFKAPGLCTETKVRTHVVLVFLLSLAFNLPRFFQYRLEWCQPPHSNTSVVTLERTDIGSGSWFDIIYNHGLHTALVWLAPLLLLVVLNSKIVYGLRASRRELRQSSGPLGVPSTGNDNITFIMVIIVLVFLLCHTPDRCLQLALFVIDRRPCDRGFLITYTITNTLVVLNSSSNFLIYYIFRRRFRQIVVGRYCRRLKAGEEPHSSPNSLSRDRKSGQADGNSLVPSNSRIQNH